MDKSELMEEIQNRIKSNSKRAEEYKSKGNLTNYGYWSRGYWEGYISALESVLCLLEEDKEEEGNGNIKYED